MYNCTQEVIDLLQKPYRQVIRITFTGKYESFIITESEIIQGGLTIDRYSISGSKIELGSAIAADLTLKLKNDDGHYDDTVFEGGELFVEIGIKKWDAHRWEQAVVHYIPCGYYIIDTPPRAKSTIKISALDRMVLLDKPADLSSITFPIRLDSFIEEVCTLCDIELATDVTQLVNANYMIQAAPDQNITYRTLIQWCAFLSGTCAYMDHEGKLVLQWYTQTDFPVTASERYSSDMYENDITITGITYTDSDNNVYVTGETDYALTYSGCDIMQNNVEFALANIYYSIRNFAYRPYEATIKPAPFLYPMDMIKYTDSKGIVHDTIVSHVTFTANANTSIAGSGETTTQNDRTAASGLTIEQQKAMQEMKQSIEVTISGEALASLNAIQILANSTGYNLTMVTENDDITFYVHNANTLSGSNKIYTLRNGHIAFTDNWNSGSPIWTNTITESNNLVMNVIKGYGLDGTYLDDNSISGDKLTNTYKSAVTVEIGQAATGAYNNAKSYSDGNLNTAKSYADNKADSALNSAKSYADTGDSNTLQSAKSYSDTGDTNALSSAKTYTNNQIAALDPTFAALANMAKKLYVTGSDGTEYAGELKMLNGKPVYEYDVSEGGN